MTRTALLSALVLFTLGASGCRVLDSVDVSVFAWEGELVPILMDGPSGSVAALTQSGRTHASIRIVDGPTGTTRYDWRLRRGTCESPADVLGGAANYPPIDHASPGTTTAEATVPTRLPDDGSSYNAVVLDADIGREIACADLDRV